MVRLIAAEMSQMHRFCEAANCSFIEIRAADSRTIVSGWEGEILLLRKPARLGAALEIADFEKVMLQDQQQFEQALVLFSSAALADGFRLHFDQESDSRTLTSSLDISLPLNGQNLYEPEPLGGFVFRWMGPGRISVVSLLNPVLEPSRGIYTTLCFDLVFHSLLTVEQSRMAEVYLNEMALRSVLIFDGQHFRLRAYCPLEAVQDIRIFDLEIRTPVTVGLSQEVLADTGRLFAFGMMALKIHVLAEPVPLPPRGREMPDREEMAARLERFRVEHEFNREVAQIGPHRVQFEPPVRDRDSGRIVAVNLLVGRYFFPYLRIDPPPPLPTDAPAAEETGAAPAAETLHLAFYDLLNHQADLVRLALPRRDPAEIAGSLPQDVAQVLAAFLIERVARD